MKIIAVAWRDMSGSLKMEKFASDDFSVRTEPGWLKIIGKQGPFRLLPSEKVHLVEFVDEPDEPRIVSPHAVAPLQPPKVS